MPIRRKELAPGIFLNMVATDRFKTGCFSFNILRPLQEDTASVNALIPSILLRGCKMCPDMKSISRLLDKLYGATVGTAVRKRGEVQAIGLSADFLEDRYADGQPVFAQMMEFVRSLITEPCMEENGFVKDYVAGEKQNLINAIDARINDKRSYAVARLLKHMCAEEAFHVMRMGEKEPLEKADSENLYRTWQMLLSQSPIEIFYMGQQTEETVTEQIQKLISALPVRGTLCTTGTKIVLPDRPVQNVEEVMEVTQGKLALGLRTPITVKDPRYPAMMLLNSVYGAGMTSKLFMKIREEQSLCYYAGSTYERNKGLVVVSSGIEFEKYQIAREGILHQLELCKHGEITREELELARNYLLSAYRAICDSPSSMDEYCIGQAIGGLQDSVEDQISRLEKVTMEQVIEAADTLYLDTVYFLKGVQAS